jgi:hypothetical protein
MRKKETLYLIPANILREYAKAYYLVDAMNEAKIFDSMDDSFVTDYIERNFPDSGYENLDNVVDFEDMAVWKSINTKDCYERDKS